MIAALAITSLFVAAADDAGPEDLMSRFHLLRGMGDLDGAYALILPSMEMFDRINFLSRLEQWVQASEDLQVLQARLTEYQAAWASVVFFENTSSPYRYNWPLTIQFENTFLSGNREPHPLTDFGVPWFSSLPHTLRPGLKTSGMRYRVASDLGDDSARFHDDIATKPIRQVYVPGWSTGWTRDPFFQDRNRVVLAGGQRAILWSIDDRDALVGFFEDQQNDMSRMVFRFVIVPFGTVKPL